MFCVYCGQQIPETTRFCQRCGKPITNIDEVSKLDAKTSIAKDDKAVLKHLALGVGVLILMYLIGESVVYPNKYSRGAIIGSFGAFPCYGILFGFALHVGSYRNMQSLRMKIERGIGGALLGAVTIVIIGWLITIAIEVKQVFLLIITGVLFMLHLPLVKSIKLSIGKNGVIFGGFENLKANLIMGSSFGLVGLGLGLVVQAAKPSFTAYSILGLIGFLNYICLINFEKT